MGRPGSGGRLAALPLAWLAGVALQLRSASCSHSAAYVALASIALAGAAALLAWPRSRRCVVVAFVGALGGFAPPAGRRRCARAEALARRARRAATSSSPASSPACRSGAERAALSLRDRRRRRTGRRAAHARARLVRGFHEDAALVQPRRALRAGQRWRFTVRLRQPHGNLNPHGFDYELELFEQGVRATGYVRDAPPPELLEAGAGYPVERLRQRVRDAIYEHVTDRRAAGVLAALAVGDQGAIERDDWDLFRNTGVAHLMSISGLHVTMFAWLAGLVVGAAVAAQRGARCCACRRRRAARWGGLLAATGLCGVLGLGRAVAAHGLDARRR